MPEMHQSTSGSRALPGPARELMYIHLYSHKLQLQNNKFKKNKKSDTQRVKKTQPVKCILHRPIHNRSAPLAAIGGLFLRGGRGWEGAYRREEKRDEKRGEGNSLTPSQAEKNKHCSSTTNMCKETERYDCRPGASAERT